ACFFGRRQAVERTLTVAAARAGLAVSAQSDATPVALAVALARVAERSREQAGDDTAVALASTAWAGTTGEPCGAVAVGPAGRPAQRIFPDLRRWHRRRRPRRRLDPGEDELASMPIDAHVLPVLGATSISA